jgi:hypothetical protein
MANLNFNVNSDDLEDVIEAVPAGEYKVIISNSDYKVNSKSTGMNLQLEYEIVEGNFKGRKIFENLCLEHEKEQTAAIARKKLNSIGVAVGVTDIKDSRQLHNIPLIVDVKVKNSEEYGMQNDIKKHLPLNSNGTQNSNPPIQNGSEDSAPKKNPWEKR